MITFHGTFTRARGDLECAGSFAIGRAPMQAKPIARILPAVIYVLLRQRWPATPRATPFFQRILRSFYRWARQLIRCLRNTSTAERLIRFIRNFYKNCRQITVRFLEHSRYIRVELFILRSFRFL